MSSTERAPRILITRLSAIGDCILTTPLACALRDHFPNAFLAWAIEPAAAKLLNGHPAIDEFVIVPKGWMKSFRQIRSLRQRLRAMHFNCVFDPQSLTKSCLLGRLSGAPRRIGFASPRGRELARWINNQRIDVGQLHLVDATLELLEPLKVLRNEVRFDMPRDADAEASVASFLKDAHLSHGYAVVNCAASTPAKTWPARRFGRTARFLGEQHDLPTVVTWAGEKEAELAQRIVAKSGGHALAAPDTSLPELAALLRRARLMISGDTGPLHLAAAVGTTCLGLYGPTRASRSGPYGPRHRVLEAFPPTAKRHHTRSRDLSLIRQISVETVCEACELLLQPPADATSSHSHAA